MDNYIYIVVECVEYVVGDVIWRGGQNTENISPQKFF